MGEIKAYTNGEITVSWYCTKCIYAALIEPNDFAKQSRDYEELSPAKNTHKAKL
ncbi:MAG: hypothetical protein JKY42_04715 [Flavobacteriales bacterium]|nr:hypothetical protein [Flavobacteriales bacterium]